MSVNKDEYAQIIDGSAASLTPGLACWFIA